MGRIENVKRNAFYGLFNSLFTMIISFITRTVFIYTLGAEYLGLNGLFTNVLGILSLADLGIANAITFSLYKPISENDDKKIGQIISLFGKAYKIIGSVILLIGLALIPFLDILVNFDFKIEINYYVIYMLFLLNSVCTYLFFSYKNTVIYASQKSYLTTKYEMFYTSIMLILQLVVLVIFKNYYIYLIIPIIINILKNYRISLIAEEMFPVIMKKEHNKLDRKEQKNIFKNIYSISMIKISGVIYSSTDNLIISTFINTVTVGIYSNYILIINIIKQFISILFGSMTASVGNLNVAESIEYKFKTFKKLNLLNFIIYGFCFTCLYQILNPFIAFWIGEKFLFSQNTVLLICITFLVPGLNNVINIFKDACGLFWETRFRTMVTAVVNLVMSIILVSKMGINGTLLGTIIAYLTTIYIVDPYVVYKKIFNKSVFIYYFDLIIYILYIVIMNYLISFVNSFFYGIEFINILVMLFFTSIIYSSGIIIFFYRNESFKDLLELSKNLIGKVIK